MSENRRCSEVYDYKDIMVILGIGKNKAYQLLKSQSFAVIKIGGSYKVSRQVFNHWLNNSEVDK